MAAFLTHEVGVAALCNGPGIRVRLCVCVSVSVRRSGVSDVWQGEWE